MSMMASATPENSTAPNVIPNPKTAPTVGVVAVTLPADSYKLRSVWLDEQTLLIGYDPAWLTFELVERIVREQYGLDVTIMSGVPA